MRKRQREEDSQPQPTAYQMQPFPKDLLLFIMLFMDLRTLWHFMHSHRFAFKLVYDNKAFQRQYLLRHVTSSELTVKQILTLPSNYHAQDFYPSNFYRPTRTPVGGFGYHLLRATKLWDTMTPLNPTLMTPLNPTLLQRICNFFLPPKDQIGTSKVGTHLLLNKTTPDVECLASMLREVVDENYDVILGAILPNLDIHSLPFVDGIRATKLELLNRAAMRDHRESFILLHQAIGGLEYYLEYYNDAERNTSTCFSYGMLTYASNPINSALVHSTPVIHDEHLDLVINNVIESNGPDELIECLTELAILRISPKSRVLQYLVDLKESDDFKQTIGNTIHGFRQHLSDAESRGQPIPELLLVNVIELFRHHGNTIFNNDENSNFYYVHELFINAYRTGRHHLSDQLDLYLLKYVREILSSNFYTKGELIEFRMFDDLPTLIEALKREQAEEKCTDRAAKIAILTDIQSILVHKIDLESSDSEEDFDEAISETQPLYSTNTADNSESCIAAQIVSTSSAVTRRFDTYDARPYLRRAVQTMIAERRQLMATRQENNEQHQESVSYIDNNATRPPQ